MTIKANEFDGLMEKFGFSIRQSRDKLAWLEYDGKVIIRTKRSHTKGKDLPFQDVIRQQMKLNEVQLRAAIRCHFSRDDYLQMLRDKGLI